MRMVSFGFSESLAVPDDTKLAKETINNNAITDFFIFSFAYSSTLVGEKLYSKDTTFLKSGNAVDPLSLTFIGEKFVINLFITLETLARKKGLTTCAP